MTYGRLQEVIAERDVFREHSIMLNSIGWRMAQALGMVSALQGRVLVNVDDQLTQLIAERDEWRTRALLAEAQLHEGEVS